MDTATVAAMAEGAEWGEIAAGVLGDAIEDATGERPGWARSPDRGALAAIMRHVRDVREGVRLYESWRWAQDECRVEVEDDPDAGRPWENDCVYDGLVSGNCHEGCPPGEGWWPLTGGRYGRGGMVRYFDVRGATRQGVADGLRRDEAGRRAVEMFERLQAWFRGEWNYVAVSVRHDASGESESLCGIESDDDYITYQTVELADELRRRVGRVVGYLFECGGQRLAYAPGMGEAEYRDTFGYAKRICAGIDMDGVTDADDGGDVWLCWVDDCFDPPLCAVMAPGPSEAEEAFFGQYDWADMSAEDLADYPADYGVPTARGTVASTEAVRVAQLRLEAVIWGGA